MLILGILIGSFLTFLMLIVYSCLVVAKQADEEFEQLIESAQHNDSENG